MEMLGRKYADFLRHTSKLEEKWLFRGPGNKVLSEEWNTDWSSVE